MSRASTIILIGTLIILTPFSGFPSSLRELFTLVLGACILGIGISLRARETRPAAPSVSAAEPTPETLPPPRDVSPL